MSAARRLDHLNPVETEEKDLGLFSASPVKISPHIKEHREMRLFLPEKVEGHAQITDHYGETHQARIINLSSFGARLFYPNIGKEKNESDRTNVKNLKESGHLHLNQSLKQLVLTLDSYEVFNGTALVINETTGKDGIAYGVALEGYGIDLERVQAILNARNKYDNLTGTRSIVSISNNVGVDFKVQVANLNALLQDLKMRLLEEETRIEKEDVSPAYRKKLEEHAVDIAMSLYQHEIHKIFDQFQAIVDRFNPEEKVIHKRFFRANFHPLILGTPFIRRAFTKPLGYAGDYGLMVMFYEYQDDGKNLFEKFFHRFACNEPAAIANKNRVEYLSECLLVAYQKHCNVNTKGTLFKICSVACGPAREFELFLRKTQVSPDFPIQLIMIDQEMKALEHASQKLRPLASPGVLKITLLAEDAVLGIVKDRPFCKVIRDSQLIVSAGLFDYLSDRVATRLITGLYQLTAESGQVIIGNVSKHNPDRFSMEYFMEWQLILRDSQDLRKLVEPQLTSEKNIKVTSETLGLNLFLELYKGS